jgi:hypothetical protein
MIYSNLTDESICVLKKNNREEMECRAAYYILQIA